MNTTKGSMLNINSNLKIHKTAFDKKPNYFSKITAE